MARSLAIAAPTDRLADLLELVKPRVTFMVVLTAAAGFAMGSDSSVDLLGLGGTALGTALIAGAAGCLNQVLERDSDARMERTRNRPLASGRLDVAPALAFGIALALVGAAILDLAVNPLTALLGVVTLALYVGVYTPLKQRTTLCTVVGAVPGALPPVMGWAGARDALTLEAWVLFAILFLWQIPHFLAIARAHREDYARGGQPMLPVIDSAGSATARQIVLYLSALLPVSLLPALLPMCGATYFWGALLLGLVFLGFGVHAARARTVGAARRLLLCSVVHLPSLIGLMVLDRVLP